ncbi:hypothetical protein JCGZ_15287 [Jatropha curcas]|uniref:Uncharacterized protein n=1 Tax=Jatropha curcas TaxID=180498 RepID=A0A067LF46_JATCU|nr:hypothetical protein JCGZ_15287 [Jatropha curcas]
MLEILWGLRLCVPFELGVPVLAGNGPESGFATAIHGSFVIRASSPELMGERSPGRGESIEACPSTSSCWNRCGSPEIGEHELSRRTVCLAPIEALFTREEAGNTTTSTRRADRHLAFVERWPETRRKGRWRRLSHA